MNDLKELKETALTNPESVVSWLESLHGKDVKWKHSANANQIVLKTDNYYYKVYAFNEVDRFNSLIRHAFAEVYRSYGIDWEIITVQTDKGFLDIERREILEVCTEWCNEILINYSKTLALVEEKLGFNDIIKQIREYYKYAYKLKLIRHSVNKPMDYALYKDKIILLDDADWVLYILDEENNPISVMNMFVKVNVFDEDYTFTHYIINPQKTITLDRVYDINDKFFLYKRIDIIHRAASLKNEFQSMLINNVNILSTKDDNSSMIEELSSMYSPFKKMFYCINSIKDIDYLTHNKIAIRQSDITNNKTLWDDICYEYVNRNLCSIHLYTSFYENSIYELCELLNQANLYSVGPITGYSHTGITLCVKWNIIKNNDLWEENFTYIQQHYPKIKIIVYVVLNEPFLQSVFTENFISINTLKDKYGIKIIYGAYDDTPKEFLPKRNSMLKFYGVCEYTIKGGESSLGIYRDEINFDSDIKECGHHKNCCLPYYDSDKCSICDFEALYSM